MCNLLGFIYQKILDWLLMKVGPIGCPETSVRNYHYTLRNSPEESLSLLLRGESLTTCILTCLVAYSSVWDIIHQEHLHQPEQRAETHGCHLIKRLQLHLVRQFTSIFSPVCPIHNVARSSLPFHSLRISNVGEQRIIQTFLPSVIGISLA